MSHPSLYDCLEKLYAERDENFLKECLTHVDFQFFIDQHKLQLPISQLVQALTHTSFSHEYQVPHQEQLEFLGDSVLQLILTEELFNRFPSENEGVLSKMRSSLVNEKTLAKLGLYLGFDKLILVGKGEFKKNLPQQESVLADTVEAVLAQIYRSQGLSFVRELFLGWLKSALPEVWEMKGIGDFDSKSTLQQKSLAAFKKLPAYTAEPKGDGFLVQLWLNDELVASGVFSSKRNGEKELANNVLKKGLI